MCMTRVILMVSAAGGVCGAASAEPFTPGNLVTIQVASTNVGGANAVVLSEYTSAGAPVGNIIALPVAGADAVSLGDLANHDRHLHRTTDGRRMTFAAYNVAPGGIDPASTLASDVPRLVGVVFFDGSVDLTTKLGASYDATSIRGVVSTDGDHLWTGGDNASGAIVNGGTQYTTRGSTTSVNLSQVQSQGQAKTPDNIRDVNIFGGQLFVCSGSSASVGKAVLKCGTGLPTSGSQALTKITTDGSSQSSFAMLDASDAIAGPDVMYAAGSTTLGVNKYVKQTNGTWLLKGTVLMPNGNGGEHVIAKLNSDGTATVFAADNTGVVTFTDPAPLTSTISGSPRYLFQAAEGYTMGGLDFAPVCRPDFNGDGFVDIYDFSDYVNCFEGTFCPDGKSADYNGDGFPDIYDFTDFVTDFEAGC